MKKLTSLGYFFIPSKLESIKCENKIENSNSQNLGIFDDAPNYLIEKENKNNKYLKKD